MVIVDTHVHASPYWYEPVEVLLFQMDSNGVDKATLVQYQGQNDNTYIMECARRFPGRFSPVVIVDAGRTDAPESLRQLAREGAGGVRLKPTSRSPGADPLAIWRLCAELGLPVTCVGTESAFASDELRQAVEALPDVAIIIEHLGRVNENEPQPYATYKKILALAKHPNTYIKVGGIGELCERPHPFRQPFPFQSVPPFIRMAYDAFGPSRMMWASNFPPCSHDEGYRNTIGYLQEHLAAFCSEGDKEWIFGKTALSLYKFG